MLSQSHNISMADSSLQKWGVIVISGKKSDIYVCQTI